MPRFRPNSSRVLTLERLETRAVPATLVGPTKLTYQDSDGDTVTVTFSKPILTDTTVANAILTFDSGPNAVNGNNTTKEQLQKINLVGVALAANTSITTVATRSATNGGDGVATLGEIDANDLDLGKITIDGDLGRVQAGDDNFKTTGLKGLTAHSIGLYGTSTGAPDLNSGIMFGLGSLRVRGDIKDASLIVDGGDFGKLGSLQVGGSLINGRIAAGALGTSRIVGNVDGGKISGSSTSTLSIAGSLIGGALSGTGRIEFGGSIKIGGNVQGSDSPFSLTGTIAGGSKVTVGGSVIGGAGYESGRIEGGSKGVKILGNVQGGAGEKSGTLRLFGVGGTATIGGSVLGGAGYFSGAIATDAEIRVGGNVQGGAGDVSGHIAALGKAGVTVGGSVIGGTVNGSGSISYSTLSGGGAISIGGDVRGAISGYYLPSIVIGGSLIAGGTLPNSGSIYSSDNIGRITIGNLIGTSTNPVKISARGSKPPTGPTDLAIGKITIKGRVEFAEIVVGNGINADAQIGPVTVGGDWIASSIVAGAVPGDDGFYGNDDLNEGKISGPGITDDPGIASGIASLKIGGQVLGTVGGTDFYGIVAENIGAVKIGDTVIPLTAGLNNDDHILGITGDFKINEF